MILGAEDKMDQRQQIRRFILENFLFSTDDSALVDDRSLIESGTVDSTGILELIMFIENTFGIRVADEEMLPQNFDSVTRVLAFVARKQASSGG